MAGQLKGSATGICRRGCGCSDPAAPCEMLGTTRDHHAGSFGDVLRVLHAVKMWSELYSSMSRSQGRLRRETWSGIQACVASVCIRTRRFNDKRSSQHCHCGPNIGPPCARPSARTPASGTNVNS